MKYKKTKNLWLMLKLFLFIFPLIKGNHNIIRNLSETDIKDKSTDLLYITNYTSEQNNCFLLNDCFNCTLNPLCRWIVTNESCIPFVPFNINYSIPILNESYMNNDIYTLNNIINYIRKVCYLPYIPYYENNNSLYYNDISLKYCGSHYIGPSYNNFENDFIIELNNISGSFGVTNILCEYIILSGSNSFKVNIEINNNYNEEFYLLYSENSTIFDIQFKESTEFTLQNTGRRANTFIYFGLKSFNSSPFKITVKKEEESDSSETLGYLMIGFIIFIFILIVGSIIYIRYNSDIFKNNNKLNSSDEQKSIKEKNNESNNEIQVNNTNKLNNQDEISTIKTNIIYKNNLINTPDKLINKKNEKIFNFNNIEAQQFDNNHKKNICCFCKNIIQNKNEIFKLKCGHDYHFNCYNLIFQNNKNNTEVRCTLCNNIFLPV